MSTYYVQYVALVLNILVPNNENILNIQEWKYFKLEHNYKS